MGICFLLFCCNVPVSAENVGGSDESGSQQSSSEHLNELFARYPTGSIQTSDQASRAGNDVHEMRRIIEEQFAHEQEICFPKFFATACLSDAKERHRDAIARVRAIEIEVNKFKRRENVMAREKSMAGKRNNPSAETSRQVDENQLNKAGRLYAPAQDLPRAMPSAEDRVNANDPRVKKHELEVEKREAAEAEDAKRRERNIAAYEKKRQESEARQRAVAAKKLERERQKKAKEAAQ
jgi:hypothetical protein